MKLSGQGERVVQALAAGRRFRRVADGWAAGSLRAPPSLAAELGRLGLVQETSQDLALSEAGQAHAALNSPSDAIRPARLLAERMVGEAGARGTRRSVTVNLLESPLGWLRARGLVDQRQFDAGERLRGDWERAGLGARVTMRWDAAPVARGARGAEAPFDPTLAGIAARRRFDEAIAAAGKGLGDILWRVVCAGEGLEAAEGALGWPRRAGKLVLTMALDRVADYYRIG